MWHGKNTEKKTNLQLLTSNLMASYGLMIDILEM